MSIKIKSVKLDGRLHPVKIKLELGLPEVAYLAKLTGAQSTDSAERIAPDLGARTNAPIYAELAGLLNTAFDGGVDEAIQAVRQ